MKLTKRIFFVLVLVGICHGELVGETANKVIALTLPEVQWVLEIDAENYEIEQKEISPDGLVSRFIASNKLTGIIMSGYLEKMPQTGTSIDCRDYFWGKANKSPYVKSDIKMYKNGQLAIVDYIVKEYQNKKINQKNINAYLAEDNYWIDIHISKVNYQPSEEVLFENILKSIKINRDCSKQVIRTDYIVPENGIVSLNVPENWCDEAIPSENNESIKLEFKEKSNNSPTLIITVLTNLKNEENFNSQEKIKVFLEKTGRELLANAVETELKIEEFKTVDSAGYYYFLTDKAPKQGEYKYLLQGTTGVRNLLLFFTILTNEASSKFSKEAITMLSNAEQKIK